MRSTNISKMKKAVWKLVSEYIRRSYANKDGMVSCYTCGKWSHWKDGMQTGHAFAGRGNAILYELDLLRVQCVGCNIMNSGRLDIFTYKLREELGVERFEELWRLKNTQRKFTVEELQNLAEEYKQKIAELNRVGE